MAEVKCGNCDGAGYLDRGSRGMVRCSGCNGYKVQNRPVYVEPVKRVPPLDCKVRQVHFVVPAKRGFLNDNVVSLPAEPWGDLNV